jgi:hypothetical protein
MFFTTPSSSLTRSSITPSIINSSSSWSFVSILPGFLWFILGIVCTMFYIGPQTSRNNFSSDSVRRTIPQRCPSATMVPTPFPTILLAPSPAVVTIPVPENVKNKYLTGLEVSERLYTSDGMHPLSVLQLSPARLSPLTHEAQSFIWKNQHPDDCNTAKYVISNGHWHPRGNGIGSILHVIGTHLYVILTIIFIFIFFMYYLEFTLLSVFIFFSSSLFVEVVLLMRNVSCYLMKKLEKNGQIQQHVEKLKIGMLSKLPYIL